MSQTLFKIGLSLACSLALINCGNGDKVTPPEQTQPPVMTPPPVSSTPSDYNVSWIFPSQNANLGTNASAPIELMVKITAKNTAQQIASVTANGTAMQLTSGDIWRASITLPADASKINYEIKDTQGKISSGYQLVKNRLFGGSPQAIEFDRLNNRLIMNNKSAERLSQYSLTNGRLTEIPVTSINAKNQLIDQPAFKYSSVDQTIYYSNFPKTGVWQLNTLTGQESYVQSPNNSNSIISVCFDQIQNQLFGVTYNSDPSGVSATAYLSRITSTGDVISLGQFSPWYSPGNMVCAGNGYVANPTPRAGKFTIVDTSTLQPIVLDVSSLAPGVPDGQIRIKHYGVGTGYLLTIVGEKTTIYRASSYDAQPQLITGASRGTGPDIWWAWDVTLDESSNQFYSRDVSGIVKIDGATGQRTRIYDETIGTGQDLGAPMGVKISNDRKYAYTLQEWGTRLQKINLENGNREYIPYQINGVDEPFDYFTSHPIEVKFSQTSDRAYQLNFGKLGIYDLSGHLIKRITFDSLYTPAWMSARGFDVDESNQKAYVIVNRYPQSPEPVNFYEISLNDGVKTSITTFDSAVNNIGITKTSANFFYLVNENGQLQKYDRNSSTLTNIGTLETVKFARKNYRFETYGKSVSLLDSQHNLLYVTYGPNIFTVDLTTDQLTYLPTQAGMELGEVSGLALDPLYDILWISDSASNSLVARHKGTNVTISR